MQQSLDKQLNKLEKIPFAAISVGDVVGKGRFKRVHRGRYKGRDVVVLRYAKDLSRGFAPSQARNGADRNAEEERDKNYNELRILASLAKKGSEPFVPEIFGACFEQHSTIIVQEFAAWSTLKSVIQTSSLRSLASNLHRLHCASQIAQAMAFLEAERVVHADLSCRNVLIFRFEDVPQSVSAKVSDFGLSVVLKEGCSSMQLRQPQATRWCAPETVGSNKLSHRADMWSLGATLWEMYSDGTAPWPNRPKRSEVATRLRDIYENSGAAEGGSVVDDDFPRAAICPPVVHTAILSCLRADEYERPRFIPFAERIARIIEAGGEADPQAEALLETSFVAAEAEQNVRSSPLTFILPPKGGAGDVETPQWQAYCALAANDDAVASRVPALRAFDVADRELLLAAEGRLKRQLDQIAELKKDVSAKQVKAATPLYPVHSEVFSSTPVMPLMGSISSTPVTPRVRAAPLAVAHVQTHSACSSPLRQNSSRQLWSATPGRFVLWFARGPGDVTQREFFTETEAWEAFKWTRKSMPCSLRDPAGVEIGCEAWNAAYMRLQEGGGSFVARPPSACGSGKAMSAIIPPEISHRSFACVTPPRRSLSPGAPMPVLSPGRLTGSIPMLPASVTVGVTPPRAEHISDLSVPRGCSIVAAAPPGPSRTPPRMVPMQCW